APARRRSFHRQPASVCGLTPICCAYSRQLRPLAARPSTRRSQSAGPPAFVAVTAAPLLAATAPVPPYLLAVPRRDGRGLNRVRSRRGGETDADEAEAAEREVQAEGAGAVAMVGGAWRGSGAGGARDRRVGDRSALLVAGA